MSQRAVRPPWFLVPAAVVTLYAAALAVARLLPSLAEADVVALALTVDLVVVVPLLYHFLLARPRGWPPLSTAPVFLLSLAGAALVLPAEHRSGLDLLGLLAIPVELFLLGFVAHKAWRGVAAYRHQGRAEPEPDALEQLRRAAAEALGVPRTAEVLAYELAVLHYALVSWRRRPAADRAAFSYHRRGHYPVVLVGLLVVLAAEVPAVHLLLAHLWSPVAAWVATALSIYGALWLLGDYRAMVLRPIHLGATGIDLRIGLRWTLHIPFDEIRAVRPLTWRDAGDRRRDDLDATVLATPDLRLELDPERVARGLYGIGRKVRSVRLAVDDPERFVAQLRRAAPQAWTAPSIEP